MKTLLVLCATATTACAGFAAARVTTPTAPPACATDVVFADETFVRDQLYVCGALADLPFTCVTLEEFVARYKEAEARERKVEEL